MNRPPFEAGAHAGHHHTDGKINWKEEGYFLAGMAVFLVIVYGVVSFQEFLKQFAHEGVLDNCTS